MLRFKSALSILSKSSPYAVSTERAEGESQLHDDIKNYLYIEMPIEKDVESKISSFSAVNPAVLFLCGSSGDGKSEILTSCKKKFSPRVRFHLDATHSFSPQEDAIETLDKLFDDYQETPSPLVVGINTGMLGNYAEEGRNELFKTAIYRYLDKSEGADLINFIDFENYPKFQIDSDGYSAEFTEKFLQKLTAVDNNIIRQVFDKDVLEHCDEESRKLQVNYELLSMPMVQKVIIELLFKARLVKDQFLTARSLLDFILTLLAGPGYLFDNLFAGGDNELASKIIEFDPAHLRTKNIDRFILANDLVLHDDAFSAFKAELKSLGIDVFIASHSYLRLFYILKNSNFSNNYHSKFVKDFNESLIDKYIKIYQLHRDYDNSSEQKISLKNFYNKTLREALRKYNNRNAPNLEKDHYLISELNGYQLVAKLDIKFDSKRMRQFSHKSSSFFIACMKVEDESITLPININLLALMLKIVDGYRPNKHDKNTVVLLDELLEEIAQIANRATILHIFKGNENYIVKSVDDDEFEVSGM